MPLHDWTRVDDGVFHDLHGAWITELRRVLNGGGLPAGYYAMGDQVLGGGSPDVLALSVPPSTPPPTHADTSGGGGVAMLTAPPRTRLVAQATRESYTRKQRRLVIRHVSGHQVVALIEVVSAGNKGSRYSFDQFLDKSLAVIQRGVHLLVLDLHPPTSRDPNGIHGAIWEALTTEAYQKPADADRTLVSYSAGLVKTAYVEPLAVGQVLPAMPLFLTPDGESWVSVPLEAAYMAAYQFMGPFYRDILDRTLNT